MFRGTSYFARRRKVSSVVKNKRKKGPPTCKDKGLIDADVDEKHREKITLECAKRYIAEPGKMTVCIQDGRCNDNGLTAFTKRNFPGKVDADDGDCCAKEGHKVKKYGELPAPVVHKEDTATDVKFDDEFVRDSVLDEVGKYADKNRKKLSNILIMKSLEEDKRDKTKPVEIDPSLTDEVNMERLYRDSNASKYEGTWNTMRTLLLRLATGTIPMMIAYVWNDPATAHFISNLMAEMRRRLCEKMSEVLGYDKVFKIGQDTSAFTFNLSNSFLTSMRSFIENDFDQMWSDSYAFMGGFVSANVRAFVSSSTALLGSPLAVVGALAFVASIVFKNTIKTTISAWIFHGHASGVMSGIYYSLFGPCFKEIVVYTANPAEAYGFFGYSGVPT